MDAGVEPKLKGPETEEMGVLSVTFGVVWQNAEHVRVWKYTFTSGCKPRGSAEACTQQLLLELVQNTMNCAYSLQKH